MAGLPYLIGNYVDDSSMPGLPSFFSNCEKYARNVLNRTNSSLGFKQYAGSTWDICYVYDSNQGYHFMRRDSNTGTWSQRVGNIITNCFCTNGQLKSPTEKITDSNLKQAFQYAGFNGTVNYSTASQ